MRKLFALSVAVAMLVIGSITQVKAQQVLPATASNGEVGFYTGAGMFAAWTAGMAYVVYRDIAAGGLNRKYAEVVPGAGYQARDYANAAKLTHEFNVAMGYADDEQTTRFLASAAR